MPSVFIHHKQEFACRMQVTSDTQYYLRDPLELDFKNTSAPLTHLAFFQQDVQE